MLPRTDLAMEAKELFERSAGEQTRLSGVLARETDRRGVRMTLVRILDAEGEQALGKPRGTYITAELDALTRREPGSFAAAARTIGRALRELLGPCRQALVVGLGNREITPDAIGPEAVRNLIVTRHLGSELPEALTGDAAWRQLLTALGRCASALRGAQRWFVEAHAFRIDTGDEGIGRPTPEGAHRDGVDLVAVVLVARHNVKGGETRVFDARGPQDLRFTLTEP